MNTHRTFGVEIECFSLLNPEALALEINNAFSQNGISHRVNITRWMSNTDSNNVSVWTVKGDSSLRHNNIPRNYYPVEIVTPVLSGHDGLEAIRVACSVIDRHCKINRTCGLHVHHGVTANELASIAEAWLRAEPHIMQAMAPSRRNNGYCGAWNDRVGSFSNPASNPGIRSSKYLTLNISSFAIRNTVEFRCHSGTTDCRKIRNWVLATQGLIEAAVSNGSRNFHGIDDVANFITSNCNGGDVPRNNYRRLRREIFEFLSEAPKSRQEIISRFGRWPSKAMQAFRADGLLSQSGNYYSIATSNGAVDNDYRQAARWLAQRHAHFNRQAA